jgi:hypothetical protein
LGHEQNPWQTLWEDTLCETIEAKFCLKRGDNGAIFRPEYLSSRKQAEIR